MTSISRGAFNCTPHSQFSCFITGARHSARRRGPTYFCPQTMNRNQKGGFGAATRSNLMDVLQHSIGQGVAAYRRKAGLTQAELAEHVGVTTEVIGRLERGASIPSLVRLAEIAEALGIGVDVLLRPPDVGHCREEAVGRLIGLLADRTPGEIDLVVAVAAAVLGHLTKAAEARHDTEAS